MVSTNIERFSDFPKKENVILRNLDVYKGGVPRSMYLVDSTLVIFNFSKRINYFFYNYHIKKGTFSKGYLKKGRGPGEAIGAFCFGVENNIFWVYDGTLNKILTFDKMEALNCNTSIYKTYPIKNPYIHKLTIIDDKSFLTIGDWTSEYKIQQINLVTQKKISEFGKFSGDIKNIPIDGFKDAYQAFIFIKPLGESIVLAYRFTDIIEVYSLKNPSKCKALQGTLCFNIDIKLNNRGSYTYFVKTDKTRKAFIGGTVSNKYIYLLYSGQTNMDENWNYAKYINIYDWDGNPVKQLTLDRYISSLAVSSDDKIFYAFDPYNGYLVKSDIKH